MPVVRKASYEKKRDSAGVPGLATHRSLLLRFFLAPFLLVQRLVGSREQFIDRTGARRVEAGDANAEGQRVATVRLRVALAQRFGQTLRDRRYTIIISVDRQHGELVPA